MQTTPCYEVAKIVDGKQHRFTMHIGEMIVNDMDDRLTLDQANALCAEMKAMDKFGQYAVFQREEE